MAELPAEIPELRFRLPGVWVQVPLHDLEEAKAAIRKVVARQLGSNDEAATAREQLRRQLIDGLTLAIDGEAQSMQIALEIVEELPLPISFTVYLPTQQLTPSIGTSSAAVMEILERGISERPDVDPETIERFATSESEVIRTHRFQVVDVEGASEPLKVLVVDYWVTVPGTKRFVLLNFHTALADAAAEMTVLFDAIVKASYWRHPASSSE